MGKKRYLKNCLYISKLKFAIVLNAHHLGFTEYVFRMSIPLWELIAKIMYKIRFLDSQFVQYIPNHDHHGMILLCFLKNDGYPLWSKKRENNYCIQTILLTCYSIENQNEPETNLKSYKQQ